VLKSPKGRERTPLQKATNLAVLAGLGWLLWLGINGELDDLFFRIGDWLISIFS
jgi:hypothetical protein